MTFKKFVAILATTMLGIGASLVAVTPAHADITTSYTGFGLREINRWVGKYEASTAGFSGGNPYGQPSADGVGTFGILKPSPGATVVAAYLTSAGADHGANEVPRPPVTTLNGQNVSYYAKNWAGKWTNFLADVTPIVQNYMSSASGTPETLPWVGTKYNIPLVYEAAQEPWGLPTYSSGLGLTVVFADDSMANPASVVFYFGSANSDGESLQMNFDALGSTPPTGSWLSLGSAWSQGGGQYSTVDIKNSAQDAYTGISASAGGDDDSFMGDGVTPNTDADTQWGLVTVGGVGDSVDNPTSVGQGVADDELYNMDSFLTSGVNSLTMHTTNPSSDDNIFQAVLSVPFVIYRIASFDTQGGTAVPSQNFSNSFTMPAAQTRDGYTFNGWFTAPTGGTQVTTATYAPTGNGNVTLYAQWTQDAHTVAYNSQGGTSVATKTYGGTVNSFPTSPTRAGYNFLGWFAASSGGSALTAPYTPATYVDITLYAQWAASTHTVTYNSQGGSAVSGGTYTGTISAWPTAPTRAGYNFLGWFAASSGGSALTAPYTPATFANVTLYAQWEQITHTVTYNSQGGSAISGGTYTGTISAWPTAPTRAGYNFLGWFAASSGGSALTAPYTPAAFANVTLYAHWQAATPTSVTLTINGWAVGQYKMTSKMTGKVKTWLNSNPGYTSASCVSYSSGPKASTAEKKAVKNRGVALCALVQQLAGIQVDSSAVTSSIKTAKGAYSNKVVITLTK